MNFCTLQKIQAETKLLQNKLTFQAKFSETNKLCQFCFVQFTFRIKVCNSFGEKRVVVMPDFFVVVINFVVGISFNRFYNSVASRDVNYFGRTFFKHNAFCPCT